jgi:hypothetical protein
MLGFAIAEDFRQLGFAVANDHKPSSAWLSQTQPRSALGCSGLSSRARSPLGVVSLVLSGVTECGTSRDWEAWSGCGVVRLPGRCFLSRSLLVLWRRFGVIPLLPGLMLLLSLRLPPRRRPWTTCGPIG